MGFDIELDVGTIKGGRPCAVFDVDAKNVEVVELGCDDVESDNIVG